MDHAETCNSGMNDSGTCEKIDTPLTQPCSAFDLVVVDTPQSRGAMAALQAKSELQGATLFFNDPIHTRRDLMHKGSAAGWHTPIGHTISNIIQGLENMFDYERPAWATDERQTLPWMISQQVERLARLSATEQ